MDLAESDEALSTRGPPSRFRVRAVGLTERTDLLLAVDTEGAVLPGCPREAAAATRARTSAAPALPPTPASPSRPHRGFLHPCDGSSASPDEDCDATAGGRTAPAERFDEAPGAPKPLGGRRSGKAKGPESSTR